MSSARILIILLDPEGNRRCIEFSRNSTLTELLRRINTNSYGIIAGDRFMGPEYYNSTLDELEIRNGMDIEMVQKFEGGLNS